MITDRRTFLKFAGCASLALAFGDRLPAPGVTSPENHFYQLPWGKVYLARYQVSEGDYIGKLAVAFGTRYDLIVGANRFLERRGLRPGDIIQIPAGARFPMAYIPEEGIIRHQYTKDEKAEQISQRYGLNPVVVSSAMQLQENWFTTPSETVLRITDAEPKALIPVRVIYQNEPGKLEKKIEEGVINRIANSFVFECGKNELILKYLLNKGILVNYGAWSFSPPNYISVLAEDIIGEGYLVQGSGHEFMHSLPFPWWSAGADEGTASFAATNWATKNIQEYTSLSKTDFLWESDQYYDGVNIPALRNRVFDKNPVENRILALKAWQKIEERFKGVIPHLLQMSVKGGNYSQEPQGPWDLKIIKAWITEKFGIEAWQFIDNQHILFTS